MKITIIGGGTAGWLTGLYFNKIGYSDITIIDSSRVGILGAGEATTPNFKGLLFQLGINEEEFLKHIRYLLNNQEKAEMIGSQGRTSVKKIYSWEGAIGALDALLIPPR